MPSNVANLRERSGNVYGNKGREVAPTPPSGVSATAQNFRNEARMYMKTKDSGNSRNHSELQAELKGDHARRVVTSQAHAQQPGGRRGRGDERSKAGLGARLTRNS